MKKYEVLTEESYNLDKNKYNLESKMCYNNVFNFFSLRRLEFSIGKFKVCYGYGITDVSNVQNFCFRHAFVLDCEKDKIIDPSLQFFIEGESSKYFIFKIFDDVNEYLDLLSKERYPALEKGLRKEQLRFQKKILTKTTYPKDYLLDVFSI